MKFKIFGRTIKFGATANEPPASHAEQIWQEFLGMRGYSVSPITALQISAVFRCVDVISKQMASMPLHMFKNTNKGKEKAVNHRVYPLVYILPNKQTTAYEFWQMYTANLLLTRGAFAKIQRDYRGYITALWNIPTSNVSGIYINSINGERYIDVSINVNGVQQNERLHEGEFLYTPGFLFDERNTALEPMRIASDVLGLTKSIGEYASSSVESTNPGGFIEVPGALSEPAYERFKSDFNANYKGASNAGKMLFLEEGSKASLFQRDMEKMQVLESRKYAVTEICRLFGIPPHMAMDMEHATFSNIEQQSLEYVRDCINPMSIRLEQSMYRDLLTDTEKTIYFFKFNTNSLLRGDTATRAAYYSTMRQNGNMTANEVRRLEDMDEKDEASGANDLHANGNMVALSSIKTKIPKSALKKGTIT